VTPRFWLDFACRRVAAPKELTDQMALVRLTAALSVAALTLVSAVSSASTYGHGRVSFTVGFKGIKSDLSIISTTVAPGGSLSIKAEANAIASNGTLTLTNGAWRWRAPDRPGLSVLTFERGGETITLNAFVLKPWTNGAMAGLNGYRIGRYDSRPFKGLSEYAPPQGFIEVNPALRKIRVSPHFTLEQFLCKQQREHGRVYALVREGMLLKLERLLEAANQKGWKTDTLHVMSGFRTPFYNASIGNKTTSSRHLFGGAADVFIDIDGDGWMDDLNGDGKVDKADAAALADLGDYLANNDPVGWPAGGLGVYAANSVHGPFVHVDARGYRARWGR